MDPRVSVVVATYNREERLLRLLRHLAAQTLPREEFEVVVVDDGSKVPVKPAVEAAQIPLNVSVHTQANGGAAAARHAGVTRARGDVIVIVDDDMQIEPDFLAEHLAIHDRCASAVVLGRIKPDPDLSAMPLFERYNASRLDRWVKAYQGKGFALHGNNVCTGNVSFRRADYLAVGGFDLVLKRSEDAELGLRLEAHGAELIFSERAFVQHGSDHTSLDGWLASAHRYGVFDLRIGRKHAAITHADPWRFFFALRAPIRPFLVFSMAAPGLAGPFARTAMQVAERVDGRGLEWLGIQATSLVYGMEYFRGIRTEAGSMRNVLQSAVDYLAKVGGDSKTDATAPRPLAAAVRAVRDFGADRSTRRQYEERYGYAGERNASLPAELVTKIGVQLAAAYRVMRMFRAAGLPAGAKVTSRLMRHAFGSDIHWDAEFEGGVMFVHGFGLAISHAAKVGPGCILSQNVTLGMGIDPETRKTGAPTLEANVHVGSGAVLVGPITVGANSKIMANVVLTHSVPANSIVEASTPTVKARVSGRPSRSRTRAHREPS